MEGVGSVGLQATTETSALEKNKPSVSNVPPKDIKVSVVKKATSSLRNRDRKERIKSRSKNRGKNRKIKKR